MESISLNAQEVTKSFTNKKSYGEGKKGIKNPF